MTPRETTADRLEKLADRLAAISTELQESDTPRSALIDDLVVALRRYGAGEDFYVKHKPVQESGVISLSRHVTNEPVVALYRPDEPDELPDRLVGDPSPVRRAELAALLADYADELTSMERPTAAVYRDLILLAANEPGCLFADHAQKYEKVYFKTRVKGMLGTTLAQVVDSVSTGE